MQIAYLQFHWIYLFLIELEIPGHLNLHEWASLWTGTNNCFEGTGSPFPAGGREGLDSRAEEHRTMRTNPDSEIKTPGTLSPSIIKYYKWENTDCKVYRINLFLFF